MKEVDPIQALHRFVEAYPDQRSAADALGISQGFLSDILRNHRNLPDRVIAALGLKQIVVKS